MLDFAVDLRERFLPAHRQHGMAQADEYSDESERLGPLSARQPPKRVAIQNEIAGNRRGR